MIILYLTDRYNDNLNFYLSQSDSFVTEELINDENKKTRIHFRDNVFFVKESTKEIDDMIRQQISKNF